MVAETFARSLVLVLKHEGGWADHPSDPGGATMQGITKATYEKWLGKKVAKAELKAIPDAHVSAIYKNKYWDAVRGDSLPAGVDYAVFDFAVNSGPSRSAKFLQKIIGAAQDGQIGPATLKLVGALEPQDIIARLCANRLAWLKRLKHWPTFGKGLGRRVNEVEADAAAMASATRPPPRQPDDPGAPQTPKPSPATRSAGGRLIGALGLVAVGAAAKFLWPKIKKQPAIAGALVAAATIFAIVLFGGN